MKTFDKLRARIKKDLDIDLINFERQYVGYWQRSAGAWVWVADKKGGCNRSFGSCESATELIKSKRPLIVWNGLGGYEIMSDTTKEINNLNK